jgi:hypothetical protein
MERGEQHSKLVVYQVSNLKVPHNYTKMVRLCFGSVALRNLYFWCLRPTKVGFYQPHRDFAQDYSAAVRRVIA